MDRRNFRFVVQSHPTLHARAGARGGALVNASVFLGLRTHQSGSAAVEAGANRLSDARFGVGVGAGDGVARNFAGQQAGHRLTLLPLFENFWGKDCLKNRLLTLRQF